MVDELKGQPGSLLPIKCDLTKDDEVLAMFARIKRELGGVDVCINNAGLVVLKPLTGECSEPRLACSSPAGDGVSKCYCTSALRHLHS